MTVMTHEFSRKLYFAIVVVSAIAIGILFWQVLEQNSELQKLSDESHRVLCAQKENTERQIADTRQFLADHPGDEPFPGISRATLLAAQARQLQFLKSFEGFQC